MGNMGQPTTQEGVAPKDTGIPGEAATETPTKEQEKPVRLARDELMDELAEKRKLQQQGITEEPPVQEGAEATPPVDTGEPGSETPPAEATPPEPGSEEAPPVEDMVEIVVEGQVIHKTQAEVDEAGGIASIQKNLAGDIRLKQASERSKDLDRREGELNRNMTVLQTKMDEFTTLAEQQKVDGVEGTEKSKEELKTKAKEITDKFLMGNSEDLAAAVEELLTVANKPATSGQAVGQKPINEDQIARKAAEYVRVTTEQTEAVRDFERLHPDLSAVKGRRDYVDTMTITVGDEHPNWGPRQVIAESIKRTRVDLVLPQPTKENGSSPPPGDPLKRKREVKRKAADTVPQASERVPQPPPAQPKTSKQIMDDIRAKRSHG